MSERPFTEEELKRFGHFLEAFGARLARDADFRRVVAGHSDDVAVAVEVAEAQANDVNVEFHDTPGQILATVVLPPGTTREDVRLHVSREKIELVLHDRRLVVIDLPAPVSDENVKATFRNNVLDVVLAKAQASDMP